MNLAPSLDPLPIPDDDAREHSSRVVEAVRRAIAATGGWMPFEAYMRLALYAPGLGYYVAGARKFGAGGDFVTAPELTSLYTQALAVQVACILEHAHGDVLELGAGSGRLAADLLASLDRLGRVPRHYRIVEVSPDLRERQRDTIVKAVPALAPRVDWLDALPVRHTGAVVLNEVLDAIPVHLIARRSGQWFERGVCDRDGALVPEDRPLADGPLRAMAEQRFPGSVDFLSELNPAAEALVEEVGRRLDAGAMLVVDYGFPHREYYHPQRTEGTLMAHYRHRATSDPLLWPGLCDLTAHVDFTAMAEAGVRSGLDVAGFANQAGFLLGCGLLECLAQVGPSEGMDYVREASAVQTLLSPAEMGELFKVLALSRGDGIAWPGFAVTDQRHRL